SYYGLWNNAESEYFYSGGGFQISYQHPIKKGALLGGINFRTINWGNQVGATFGYSVPYVSKEKWSLSGVTSADLGLALFVNNPLLVYAVDYTPFFTWHRNKRFDFEAGIGIRFTHCPAYGNYGKINQVLDLPLKLGVKYQLQ
ncbi:MAG: hypothetical protein R3279_13555, partial [Putridiphycobacter sp.]|nr:hypothetical protein [Putridiphycobacter sp.]